MASTGRIIRVEGDTLRTQVTGLRNGVAESFLVYAATERGRSEAADSVTATPTSGMEGEVAGLIVKFTGSPNLTDGQSDVPGEDKVSSVDLTADTKIADDVHLIELSESVSTEQANQVAAELQSDPSVEWAEPDVFVFPSSVPSDPEYESSQWNLWDEWGLGLPRTSTNATTSFDSQAGAGVTVAVIDTGITSHPDLDSQLVPGYDFVSDPENLAAPRVAGGPNVGFDADGQPGRDADPTDPGDWRGVTPTRDSTWHGTQVAGVIAAQAGNSEGIVGVAPGAKIQPIRALSWRGGLMSDIISSITWASGGSVDGAPANATPSDVITMSFAANAQCSVALQTAIDDANERGSILVAAAGNANDDVANYAPANCRGVIAVAATGRDGKRAPYSNYGPGIDIAAPGGSLTSDGGVLSTSNSGTQGPSEANYRSSEGTSIAAAHVAGALARLRSAEPGLSAGELRARFLSAEQVRAFPNQQCDPDPNITCGSGLVVLFQTQSAPVYVEPNRPPGIVSVSGNTYRDSVVNCLEITTTATFYSTASRTNSWVQVGNGSTCTISLTGGASLAGVYSGLPTYRLDNSAQSVAITRNGKTLTVIWGSPPVPVGPSLSPSSRTVSVFVNTAMTATSALTASGFSADPTFTITPALPAGLSLNSANGVISGTPSVVSTTQQYTITATAGSESATSTVTLTVNPPTLSPASQTASLRIDVGMTPTQVFTPLGFTAAPNYTISPTLPAGLTLNSSNGSISGTPTEVSQTQQYTITGTVGSESATSIVTLTVNPPPVALVPGLTQIQGSPNFILELDCDVQTGNPVVNVPHFTDGSLVVNTTGSCTTWTLGKVDEGIGGTTGADPAYSSSFTVLPNTRIDRGKSPNYVRINYYFAIRPSEPLGLRPQTQSRTSASGLSLFQTSPMTADGFASQPTFSISPPLPAGLVLDPATGVITGTPTAAQAAKTYTITASAGTQSATATVSLTVNAFRVLFDRNDPITPGLHAQEFAENAGDAISLPSAPTKTSHVFNGWFSSRTDPSTRIGSPGETFIPSASLTLYAQWTGPYTISFDSQGGSSRSAEQVTPGTTLAFPSNPTRTGFTFAGWFDSPCQGNQVAAPFTPTQNATLYAQWIRTLKFNKNNNTIGATPSPADIIVNLNSVPSCRDSAPSRPAIDLPTITRPGYKISGWFSSASGGTKYGNPGDPYQIPLTGTSSSFTMYAQWVSATTPRFDPGNLGQSIADSRCLMLDDGKCQLEWVSGDPPLELPTPISTRGLTFKGWYNAATGWLLGGGGYSWSSPASWSLIGKWEGTTSFDGNGGSVSVPSFTKDVGSGHSVIIPYRPGFAFEGWFKDNGDPAVARGVQDHTVSATETWTARWLQIQGAPVLESATLSQDRTTITAQFSSDLQVLYGTNPRCWEFPISSSPVGTGFFNNVNTQSCTVSGSVLTIKNTTYPIDDAITNLTIAYAGQSLVSASDPLNYVHQTSQMQVDNVIPGATVTFNANGGSGSMPSQTASSGSSLNLNVFTRDGFVFSGWNTSRNGRGTSYADGASFPFGSDETLYAQWARVVDDSPVIDERPRGGPPVDAGPPVTPPRLDVRPPRIELETPVRPTPARPSAGTIAGEEIGLAVERDEENTELDVSGDGFSLTVATSDTERTRIAPSSRRSLVAPVRGFVEVSAAGYAPQSTVALYLVPTLSGRMSVRNATELYFLGEVSVGEDQTFGGDFQLPEWALAGEYSLQINGYTPEGALKSINLRLDLIDKRADAVSVARACVFPEDSVQLTTECRQSLRSLKQMLPESVDTLMIDITGVAYAQGNKKLNRAVALERAERVQRFLERNDIAGDVTVDVVTRKDMAPGLTLGPPPVVVGDSGKPASTVVMTVEWTTEIGPADTLSEMDSGNGD